MITIPKNLYAAKIGVAAKFCFTLLLEMAGHSGVIRRTSAREIAVVFEKSDSAVSKWLVELERTGLIKMDRYDPNWNDPDLGQRGDIRITVRDPIPDYNKPKPPERKTMREKPGQTVMAFDVENHCETGREIGSEIHSEMGTRKPQPNLRPKPQPKQTVSRKSPETQRAAPPPKPAPKPAPKPETPEITISQRDREHQEILKRFAAGDYPGLSGAPDKMSPNRPRDSKPTSKPHRNLPTQEPVSASNSDSLHISNISIDQLTNKYLNQVDQLKHEKQQIIAEVQELLRERKQIYMAYMVGEAVGDGVMDRAAWERMRDYAKAKARDPGRYIQESLKSELKPMNYEKYKDRGKGIFKALHPYQPPARRP